MINFDMISHKRRMRQTASCIQAIVDFSEKYDVANWKIKTEERKAQ